MKSNQSPGSGALPNDLRIRALSASVLVIIAMIELYLGGSYFVIFVGLLAAGMIWEALNLTSVQGKWRRNAIILFTFVTFLLLMPDFPGGALPVWIILSLMGGILTLVWSISENKRSFPLGMVAAASVFLGCLVILLSELRSTSYPLYPLLVLVPAVIGTDIGAYFTGRALGGPRLAPAISPNKTWSGSLGGVVAAVLAGLLTVWIYYDGFQRLPPLIEIIALLIVLSICAQIGDLVESWLKRRAGKKDSGWIIPGHGGLLDRFDGFLGAAVLGMGPWLLFQEFIR